MMEWCNTTYFLYKFCSITASLNINNTLYKEHKLRSCSVTDLIQRPLTSCLARANTDAKTPTVCLYEMLLYWMSQWLYKTIICVQNLTQHITFIFITQSKFFPGQDMCISAQAHSWAYLFVYLLYNMTVLGSKGNKSIILWFCRGAREDWRMH